MQHSHGMDRTSSRASARRTGRWNRHAMGRSHGLGTHLQAAARTAKRPEPLLLKAAIAGSVGWQLAGDGARRQVPLHATTSHSRCSKRLHPPTETPAIRPALGVARQPTSAAVGALPGGAPAGTRLYAGVSGRGLNVRLEEQMLLNLDLLRILEPLDVAQVVRAFEVAERIEHVSLPAYGWSSSGRAADR